MQRPQSNFHNVRNIHHEAYNPSYYQNYTFPHFQPTFQYNSQNAFKRSHGSQGRNHDVENWCETCDRSFNSVDLLEQHKQQHQVTNINKSIIQSNTHFYNYFDLCYGLQWI